MKGQTTFEYLLLVAGVVVIALIVIAMLTSNVSTVAQDVNSTVNSLTESLKDLYSEAMDTLRSYR